MEASEQPISTLDSDHPLAVATELHNEELDRRRNQLWIGLWFTTVFVLDVTFIARRLSGESIEPLSILLQVTLHLIVFANLVFLKTRYAEFWKGIFLLCIHLAVPPVLILYGGTRGFGDIAIIAAVLVAVLYGWRPWMLLTFGAMSLTLIWVLYRDSIGQPVAPFLDYSAQFTALKFIVTLLIMAFFIRYMHTFYQGLIEKYRGFAEEQLRLNRDLQASERELGVVNQNLKISRQNIVMAREEERRRLQRDLHDGLGPTLAAQIFRIGVARNLVEKAPEKTAVMLDDLEKDIDQTLKDVRRLVYSLRLPLLDQFGLLGAISDFVGQQQERIDIHLDLPEQLPPLNAAVEVATYRILQTALDNVTKHAQATRCIIRLRAEPEALVLTVEDDGIGLPDDLVEGVGLTSMRERAEELSGTFRVSSRQPQGTRLEVAIPLVETETEK